MRIYLIRHGATAGNMERRYVGITDEALTETAARELRALQGHYPLPDRVFASPMRRCLQTAQLLFPGREPEVSADLRECAFGVFEYKNYLELAGNEQYQAWIDSGGLLAFPGGESREAFSGRCCAAFEECCRQALRGACGSAAFVVHGGTIMAILDRYARPHRDYFDWQVPNAGGYVCTLTTDTGEENPESEAEKRTGGREKGRAEEETAVRSGELVLRVLYGLSPEKKG